MPNGWQSSLSALSLGGIIFAFAGSAPAITLTGEAKNAQKTIPFVLGGALLICFAIYLLLQIAFIGAVSPEAIAKGWPHLQFPGSTSPFIGIAEGLHQGWLHYLILCTAVITPLGTAVIFVATSSRTAYALSENGFFPKVMEKLNQRQVPYMGVILNFIVGMILFFPVPGWQGMMGFLIAAFVLGYAVGPLSTHALRKQIPQQARAFKVPCYRIWCYLALFFSNMILYWTGWEVYSKMLIAITIGLFVMSVYQLFRKHRVKLDARHGLWSLGYIYGLGIISKLGHFGGGTGLINDQWDLPVLAVFSLALMLIAQYYALPAERSQNYVNETHV
jgi:amino acid transporter